MKWKWWRHSFSPVANWPKFGNSSIPMREVIINFNFIKIWPEKPIFLRDGVGSSSVIWYGLKMMQQYGKSVKTKSQYVLRANSYFWRSQRGKTGTRKGSFCSPHHEKSWQTCLWTPSQSKWICTYHWIRKVCFPENFV